MHYTSSPRLGRGGSQSVTVPNGNEELPAMSHDGLFNGPEPTRDNRPLALVP